MEKYKLVEPIFYHEDINGSNITTIDKFDKINEDQFLNMEGFGGTLHHAEWEYTKMKPHSDVPAADSAQEYEDTSPYMLYASGTTTKGMIPESPVQKLSTGWKWTIVITSVAAMGLISWAIVKHAKKIKPTA
jgi:hypothetical protein